MRIFKRSVYLPDPLQTRSEQDAVRKREQELHKSAVNYAANKLAPAINHALVSLEKGIRPRKVEVKTAGLWFTIQNHFDHNDCIQVKVDWMRESKPKNPIQPEEVYAELSAIYSDAGYDTDVGSDETSVVIQLPKTR